MKFKLNQRVAWVSQSNGTRKEKHGVIFRIVPPNQDPLSGVMPYVYSGQYSRPSFGRPRNHESYIVEVREPAKYNSRQPKPKLYWPRVARLEED